MRSLGSMAGGARDSGSRLRFALGSGCCRRAAGGEEEEEEKEEEEEEQAERIRAGAGRGAPGGARQPGSRIRPR